MKEKLIAITTYKNEEEGISKFIFSMLYQTVLPVLHVCVDDHSRDSTSGVLISYLDNVKIIKSKQKEELIVSRGIFGRIHRNMGQALRFAEDEHSDWEYVLNVDMDTYIPYDYCEKCISEIENDKKIGMIGSSYIITENGKEYTGKGNVRGCNFIISREFFEKARRLYPFLNDVINDSILIRIARILNYEVRRIDLEVYSRSTSEKYSMVEIGYGYYFLGTPFLRIILQLRDLRSGLDPMRIMCGYLVGWRRGFQFFNRGDIHRLHSSYYRQLMGFSPKP